MAGVFDIDLDQPEDAGSDEELEEGVRTESLSGAGSGRAGRPPGGAEHGGGVRGAAAEQLRRGETRRGEVEARAHAGEAAPCPGSPGPDRGLRRTARRRRSRSGGAFLPDVLAVGFVAQAWRRGLVSHVGTSVRECSSVWHCMKGSLWRQNQKQSFEMLRGSTRVPISHLPGWATW